MDDFFDDAAAPKVYHWILCQSAVVIGPVGPFNHYSLLGVGYRYEENMLKFDLTTDRNVIESLCLFARFYDGTGAREYEINIIWLDSNNEYHAESPIETYGPFNVYFRENQNSRDYTFHIRNVPIPGAGRYAIELCDLSISEYDSGYIRSAIEHFEVDL